MPAPPFLAVEKADDEIVVTLAGPRLAQENARLVAGLLFRLAEEAVRPRLLLDCRNVLSVTAAGLGKLVALHKGVRSLGGQLALCHVAPHLAEVFEVTHLTRVLEVRRASAGPGDATRLRDTEPPPVVRLAQMADGSCGWQSGQPL
jgi:anti-anti-sigma factor